MPNLVIALGISPPNGILRYVARLTVYGYRVVVNWLFCGKRGSSARLMQHQQSVYDSTYYNAYFLFIKNSLFIADVMDIPHVPFS